MDVEITMKVRQTVAFKTEADPHEIEFVDGDAVDEDGFYFRFVSESVNCEFSLSCPSLHLLLSSE